MDKKIIIIIIIIILGIIILAGAIGYAYNYVHNMSYKQGFQDSSSLMNKQIIKDLKENGYITVYIPINETNAYPVKLVPYQEKTSSAK